jgi:hypothetical protein
MSSRLHCRSSPSAPEQAARIDVTHVLTPRRRRMAEDCGVVQSDLTDHEPVSEAEIRLVLSALGDILTDILNPTSPECPASISKSDV